MHFKLPLFFVLLFCVIISSKSTASDPVKFGKIEIEEFKDLVYAPDTSASAVVLCNYGYFDSRGFKFILTRRVKILKKEGVNYAEYVFGGGSNVLVRGKTYNLVNGEIVEDKLKTESIFKERVIDQYYRNRVAMPNVKVGSIIDIEISQPGLPGEFRFQERIPVKHAELVLETNSSIEFRKKYVGYIPLTNVGSDIFKAENVPAFKPEPFMDSEENYITKFEFDLLRVSIPGYIKSFTSTWADVDKILRDHPNLGMLLNSGSGYLSDLSDEIARKYSNQLDRTKAAYEAIKSINWNKSESLYPSTNALGTVFKKQVGNSADINMMLIHLLNRMDIEVSPVVLSTRSNGFLNEYFPSLRKLNYLIVCATIDGKDYLMDGTEKYLPFGMLPDRCLNGSGRIFGKKMDDEGRWVTLTTDRKENSFTIYELNLKDDLTLSGKLKMSRTDYGALNFRCEFSNNASDESYINKLESQNPGLTIKDYKISGIDSLDLPASEDYDVEIKNKVESTNGIIMINPFFYNQLTENPHKLEERKYPINFPYLTAQTHITKITIPDNLAFSEIPKPISIVLPENSGVATINYLAQENSLTVLYKLQINKKLFLPEEYETIKELYAQIIKKQTQPVIIKSSADVSKL
jgi:hypothetical protein